MIIGIILILVVIIVGLMIYNILIYKKIQVFSNINQKVVGLNILQDFMNTIGEYSSVDEKIEQINRILIERYEIKYSTIVVFNGAEYVIKATNVEKQHWDTLANLHNEEIFADSISSSSPKYITINTEEEKLPYQKMEFGRAKSAMFFPLYIDNIYIGYWIIESSIAHAFDKLDTTLIEVVKENIIGVLKTVAYQSTVENIVRTDKFSSLKSAEYLYGNAKKIVDKYTISTVCMFKVANLENINEVLDRKLGNKIITMISQVIGKNLSQEYIFVRYMGPKFVIVFSGVEPEAVIQFIKDIKKEVERKKVYLDDINEEEQEGKVSKQKEKNNKVASPKLNFVVTTYYKGTAMEGVTSKLEEFLDNAKKEESGISYI